MCIAIVKKKGVILDPIIYRNSFLRNGHGAGFSYVKDNQLIVTKGINDIEEFLAKVQEVEEHELMIHFRLMSKGEISTENCHPFVIKSEQFPQYEFAIMHNGTLSWRSTKEKSDTRFFIEDAIQPLIDRDPFFFEYGIGRAMMGSFIGTSNKIAVMRLNKENTENPCETWVINKLEGIEYKECWFSNMSFTDDVSRYVFEGDRKKIEHWKPKLYVEPKVTTTYYGGSHAHQGMFQDDWDDNRTTGTSSRSVVTTPSQKDWKHDKDFGWYNTNPNFKGKRCLKDYTCFKTVKEKVKGTTLDPMPYLTAQEIKNCRKECVLLIKHSFPEFDFKGCTTLELAAWARSELREALPGLKNMSNEKIMRHILNEGQAVQV